MENEAELQTFEQWIECMKNIWLAARASESSPPQPKRISEWRGKDLWWSIAGEWVPDVKLRQWCHENMRGTVWEHVDVVRQGHIDAYKAAATAPSAPPTKLSSALRGLMYLTDQGREGGLILSRYDGKPITNGDQDFIDRAYIAAEAALAASAPAQVRGTWPEHCIQRAFVEGAAWWQFHANGATMFASERDEAEAEAIKKYAAPSAPPTEIQVGPLKFTKVACPECNNVFPVKVELAAPSAPTATPDKNASGREAAEWEQNKADTSAIRSGSGFGLPSLSNEPLAAPTATDWMRQAGIEINARYVRITQEFIATHHIRMKCRADDEGVGEENAAIIAKWYAGEHAGADKERP